MSGTTAGALKGWETRRAKQRGERITRPLSRRNARARKASTPLQPIGGGPRKNSGKAAGAMRLGKSKRPLQVIDPSGPEYYDPFIRAGALGRELYRIYGRDQIRQALSVYSNDKLSQMAEDYGLRPARTKRENINQIVRYLNGKQRK